MGERHENFLDRGQLLGREGTLCWDHQGAGYRGRPSPFEIAVGGDPVRGPFEMGRQLPGQAGRGPSMWCGLPQASSGWADPCNQGSEDLGWDEGPMDGQPHRCSPSRRRGSRRDEEVARKSNREGSRQRGETREVSGGQTGCQQFPELKEKERQKEKEKEEGGGRRERQDQGCRGQGPDSSVWRHCHGSFPRSAEKDTAESTKDGQEEGEEGYIQLELIRGRLRQEQPCSRGGGASLWGGTQSESPMEEVSRSSHGQHLGADVDHGRHAVGAALGFGLQCATSFVQPVLEDGAESKDEWTYEPGNANTMFPTRPHPSRTGGSRRRRGDSEVEEPGAVIGGWTLPDHPASGADAVGGHLHDLADGSSGGVQDSQGRVAGKSIVKQAVGEKERLGPQRRREQRKGQNKRRQRKEQRQGRKRRASKGREGQGSEVRARLNGEPMSSVVSSTGTAEGPAGSSSRPACCLAGSLEHNFSEAILEPTGSIEKAGDFSTTGKTYGDLATSFSSMFSQLEVLLSSSRSKIQSSGSIFPLPDCPRALEKVIGRISEAELEVLSGVCRALNSYHGTPSAERAQLPAATRGALEALARSVSDSGLCGEKFEGLDWGQFLDVRTVDYKGDEIRVAKSFAWCNIEPALPPGIGSIPLSEVCERGTLNHILDFEKYLVPEEHRIYTKPPRIFVQEDSWEQVCSGLLERGVCRLIPESEVYHVQGKPLFSGLFGVPKDEFTPAGVEVFRLIMNLVPVNKLCRNLGGDVSTLPSIVGLGATLLDNGEVPVMSSEDIKCFFYLFSVPTSWHKFLTFGKAVPRSLLKDSAREPHYLCSLVLPMVFFE